MRSRRHVRLRLEGRSEGSTKAKQPLLSSLSTWLDFFFFLNNWVSSLTFSISSHPQPDHCRLWPRHPLLPLPSFVWGAQSNFWRLFPRPKRKYSASYCSAVNTNATESRSSGKTWFCPKDEEVTSLFGGVKCNGSSRHKHFFWAGIKTYLSSLSLSYTTDQLWCVLLIRT